MGLAMEEQETAGTGQSLWQQTNLLSLVNAEPTPVVAVAPSLAEAPPAQPGPLAGRPVPNRLLILDTETTGLDPAQHHCIEVGAVLFDVPHRAVLSQVSFLLPCLSNDAEAINGIPAAVSRLDQPWRQALDLFNSLVEAADVLVAHNVPFDRQWFGRGPLPALGKPWLCSMEDLRWPAERQLRATPSVRDLALAYGVPVWAAHRALTDCIYLAQVFERCDDLEALLAAGLEPRQLYRAQLSYDERHRARQAGFRWNDPIPKAWSRRLSEREAAVVGFPVAPVTAECA
ncbi:3'-5' exonuclease [Synechococcus sp. CS-602]|nr:3'-5' exonuclease [Synechococcus sp. CS-602]MCT0245819.1 3'-5' exonuclease [Synechococcus sp. CS-601]TWB95141.1 DNA polymerase-3 subunit epsilon [Synechococcus sp. Ace-Pa]